MVMHTDEGSHGVYAGRCIDFTLVVHLMLPIYGDATMLFRCSKYELRIMQDVMSCNSP